MKKFRLLLCVVISVLLCGMVVCAETPKDPKAIMDRAAAAQQDINVLWIEEYITVGSESGKFITVGVDKTNNLAYFDMFGLQMYSDDKNDLVYYCTGDKWYVHSAGGDSVQDNQNVDNANEMVTIDEEADAKYTYVKQVEYKGVLCEEIKATVVEDNVTSEIYYYINATTYALCGVVQEAEGMKVELVCTYPERIEIPANVVSSATLATGDLFSTKTIDYVGDKNMTVSVANVNNSEKNVVIPDKVTLAGKDYKVVGISDKAFYNDKKLTKLTIGKNVKKIGKQAFHKCKKLKSVTIKSTKISKIGTKAFSGTSKQLKVKVPKAKLSKYSNMIKKAGAPATVKVVK